MSRSFVIAAFLLFGALPAVVASESAFHFDYEAADQTSASAVSAAERAGSSQAGADIAGGRFQIIDYGEPVAGPVAPVIPRDPDTGFAILALHDCTPTPAFTAHVAAYNAAMRQWYRRHAKTPNT